MLAYIHANIHNIHATQPRMLLSVFVANYSKVCIEKDKRKTCAFSGSDSQFVQHEKILFFFASHRNIMLSSSSICWL